MDIKIVENGKHGPATEYFCYDCGQLRLTYTDKKSICMNCGSTNIVAGKVGELDKDALKKKYNDHNDHEEDEPKTQKQIDEDLGLQYEPGPSE